MPLINARSVSNIILGRDSVRRGEKKMHLLEFGGRQAIHRGSGDTCSPRGYLTLSYYGRGFSVAA